MCTLDRLRLNRPERLQSFGIGSSGSKVELYSRDTIRSKLVAHLLLPISVDIRVRNVCFA
jgi:hypothetical protein